jgi:hypothetical protein
MRITFSFLLLLFFVSSCKKAPTTENTPVVELLCGDSISMSCLSDKWTISEPATASYTVLPNAYNGKNCLLLVNPHDSSVANPPGVILGTVIKNIKKNTSYKISCDAKIKGFPDFVSNPSFLFYAYANPKFYGEHYYWSTPGVYHYSDWSNHSYIFISGEETTLNFQMISLYDSTWVSNLKILEL